MICPNCKNMLNEGMTFCPYCGINLGNTPNQMSQPIYQQNLNNKQPNKKNNRTFIALVVVVILIVLGVVGANIFVKKNVHNENSGEIKTDDKTKIPTGDITGKVDRNTNLTYDASGAFLMYIEDILYPSDGSVMVSGTIKRGTLNLNDKVQILGLDKEIITTTVTAIKKSKKTTQSAKIGDSVELTLDKISRSQVNIGQALARPNSITASKKMAAEIYVLTAEEGGRHTPFFDNYRPQFHIDACNVTGHITLEKNTEMVMPGETANITVELQKNVAMEVGSDIIIKEGGRVVARGKVTEMY